MRSSFDFNSSRWMSYYYPRTCLFQEDTSPKSIPTVGDHKKNGTLAGVAAAAAAAKKEEAKAAMSGIVVQFPEMFSLKRDRHILEKFAGAEDVRMQK